MFCGDGFRQKDEDTFLLEIPENRDYKILQLTDLHLGFGLFSHKKDKMALDAVTKIINRTSPDLIVFTGDTIFPFLPKADHTSGTGISTSSNHKESLYPGVFSLIREGQVSF